MTLLIAIIALFTVWMAVRALEPLLGSQDEQLRDAMLDADMRQVEELIARRMLILDNLRELELDHQMAKLDEADYTKLRRRYELQALGVIRKLNALYGGDGWEARLDDALVAYQRQLGVEAPAQPSPAAQLEATPEVEAKAEASSETLVSPTLISCHACGASIKATSKFCSECGAPQGDAATEQDAPASPQDSPTGSRDEDDAPGAPVATLDEGGDHEDGDSEDGDAFAGGEEEAALGAVASSPLVDDPRAVTPLPDTREAVARAEVE